jgi:Ca-activated chloride channel family protein
MVRAKNGAPLLAASIITLGAVFFASPLLSQDVAVNIKPRTPSRSLTGAPANIRVDATLVLIPVTVTDAADHPVTDLSSRSFRVFEDQVEQTVSSFSRQDGPVSVGFIVDASRSMQSRIDYSLAAIYAFLSTQNIGDEWFLMRFSDSPTMLTRLTDRPEEILSPLSTIGCDDSTALNDAIYMGLNEIHRAKNSRKALIVLTDGGDNHSRYTDSEVARLVRESDVRIYSIGLFGRVDFLDKLGEESGGKAFWTKHVSEVPAAVESLSSVFRNEYVLGYAPKNSSPQGKYRRVVVQVTGTTAPAPLRVSWRRGYYFGL